MVVVVIRCNEKSLKVLESLLLLMIIHKDAHYVFFDFLGILDVSILVHPSAVAVGDIKILGDKPENGFLPP